MKLPVQLPGLPGVLVLVVLALCVAGGAQAQQEGFGGDGEKRAPGAEDAPGDEESSDDAPSEQKAGDEEVGDEGVDGDEGEAALPNEPLPDEPAAPLFSEPDDRQEIYPSAPLDDDPPPALEPAPADAAAPTTTDEPAEPQAPARDEREEQAEASTDDDELYGAGGKQAVANPLVEPDPDPPPDGWGNWSASGLQYGTGLCSACACCGTSGIIGGAALAAGIVIPGGSVIFGPLVACFGCVSIVGAPGVGSSAAVFLREWVGIWRGPWLWTLLAAYAVELLAVALIAAGAVGATVLLANFVSSVRGSSGQFYDLNPVDQWAWEQAGAGAGVFVASFLTGLGFAIVAPSAAGTLVYQFAGEQKHTYDIGFRMPGFFGPNHPDPPKVIKPDSKGHERNRARPVPEPASMRF